MEEEISIECVGRSFPDKNNYVVVIDKDLYDETTRSWECCYNLLEKKFKEIEKDKDLSTIKKSLQEKGFVKLRDKQYAIGTIIS